MIVYEDDLIVGGQFTQAGGQLVNRIARWDGSSWHALGSGANGNVMDFAIYAGDLVAAGGFTSPASCVAVWDGSAWSGFGAGIDIGWLYATTSLGALLFVGGDFHRAGGQPHHHIAIWNGSDWVGGAGFWLNDPVYELETYGEVVVAGGEFTSLWGSRQSFEHIAYWDEGWRMFPHTPNAAVHALGVHEGDLIVGGDFTAIGPTSADYIAGWDGSSWYTLGIGMNGPVKTVASYRGALIAGGNFTQAGSSSASFIARWNGSD
jgi:hypothetical protein